MQWSIAISLFIGGAMSLFFLLAEADDISILRLIAVKVCASLGIILVAVLFSAIKNTDLLPKCVNRWIEKFENAED